MVKFTARIEIDFRRGNVEVVLLGTGDEIGEGVFANGGVVVEKDDEISAVGEGLFNADVVAARVTEILVVLKIVDFREFIFEFSDRTVAGSIIDQIDAEIYADRRRLGNGLEAFECVLVTVPVENNDGNSWCGH